MQSCLHDTIWKWFVKTFPVSIKGKHSLVVNSGEGEHMADLEDFYDQKATELAEKLVRTLQQDRDDLGNRKWNGSSRKPTG